MSRQFDSSGGVDNNSFILGSECNNQSDFNCSSANESYYYDYDYLKSIDTLFWSELAPPLLVYSFTYAVGVVGNFLLIFTIARYRRLKSPTNVFLASLASTDLLLILTCIPVKVSFSI